MNACCCAVSNAITVRSGRAALIVAVVMLPFFDFAYFSCSTCCQLIGLKTAEIRVGLAAFMNNFEVAWL
jgi:hypothetical protein